MFLSSPLINFDSNSPSFKPTIQDSYQLLLPKEASLKEKLNNSYLICKFRITGKQPELWNAETGKMKAIAEWRCEGEVTSIPLNFTSEESFFIVFRNSNKHSTIKDSVVKVSLNMPVAETKVLPDLKIIKAEYGYFLPEGMVDVTDILSANIKENRLQITADNNIVNDPTPGVKKEMRVEYSVDGKLHTICVEELQSLTIPSEGENGKLKLIKALYGRFTPNFNGNLPKLPIDITQQKKVWFIP